MLTHDPQATGDDSPLRQAALEVHRHVREGGWDQPPRLFALVSTREVLAHQPEMAAELGDPDGYTLVEQDGLPLGRQLEDVLTEIEWPEAVAGCAAVIERIMLPPEAEASLPEDPDQVAAVAAAHPDRRDVRIVAAVLRDESAHSLIEGRDIEDNVAEGPNLVPGLVDLLLGTFT